MGFFLGTETDAGAAKVDYQAKHLTTHGLIFGMTGSGKTGLALGLLEEAQRARIPIIAIDPKGDLANLALAWPDLSPKYFAAWLDLANLDGRAPLDVAEAQANVWRNGLAKDGLGEADIAAMRQSASVAIYTPGSTSGIPVSLLDRFEPPPGYSTLPEEDKSELVGGIVAALLALVKIDADPLQSKEYILLATILSEAWSRGEALDLPKLVQSVSVPPFTRLGVFELDEFFPPKKRRDFAMQLNGLIASPSFQAWLTGVPLDIDRLMRKEPPGGQSRTSIFSIAHLDDAERMSFVTLLLDRVIAWMRAQPGTGELRAIIYMDEVFGYLPPHPLNPPSKRPLLTLLKQARAYGVGVLLATQNPVDVDYKALTNAGTWMIGKLQTDQDKERILDGLMGAQTAAVEVSRADVSDKISALQGRQFLLQNAHEGRQRTFKTRFCMSYLRGPLTRQEIGRLRELDFYNAPEVAALAVRYTGPAKTSAPPPKPAGGEVVGEVVESSAQASGPAVDARVDVRVEVGRAQTREPAREPARDPVRVPEATLQSSVRGLTTRYLPSQLLLRSEVRAALGLEHIYAQGPLTLRPALFGDAKISYQIDQWGRAHDRHHCARGVAPAGDAGGGVVARRRRGDPRVGSRRDGARGRRAGGVAGVAAFAGRPRARQGSVRAPGGRHAAHHGAGLCAAHAHRRAGRVARGVPLAPGKAARTGGRQRGRQGGKLARPAGGDVRQAARRDEGAARDGQERARLSATAGRRRCAQTRQRPGQAAHGALSRAAGDAREVRRPRAARHGRHRVLGPRQARRLRAARHQAQSEGRAARLFWPRLDPFPLNPGLVREVPRTGTAR